MQEMGDMKSEVAKGLQQMLAVTTPAVQIAVFRVMVSTELDNSLDFYRLLVNSLPGKYSSLGVTDEEQNPIRFINPVCFLQKPNKTFPAQQAGKGGKNV